MAKYQQVEYIEGTGTQYINTGLKFCAETDGFEAVGQSSDVTHNGMILATSNNYTWMYFYGGSGIRMYFYDSTGSQRGIAGISHDLNKHWLLYFDKTYYVDGIRKGDVKSYTFNESSDNMTIGRYGGSYYFKGKIYSIKMFRNGVITRDFVPCYRISDNAIGMFDNVESKFYPNAGTGTFGKGANVTTHMNIDKKGTINTAGMVELSGNQARIDPLNFVEGNEIIEN